MLRTKGILARSFAKCVYPVAREPRHRKPAFLRLAFTEATTLLNFPFCKVPSAVCSLARPGVLANPAPHPEPAHFDVKEVNCERKLRPKLQEILLTAGARESTHAREIGLFWSVLAGLSHLTVRMSARGSVPLRSTASHRVNTSRGDPSPFYAKLGRFSSLWQRSCWARCHQYRQSKRSKRVDR